MTQAEIAGGRLVRAGELPSRGLRLNDFHLKTASGQEVRLSDYRGRSNLVVFAAGNDSATMALMAALTQQYSRLEALQATVLLIVQRPREAAAWKARTMSRPYPTLIDGDGHVHRELGAVTAHGKPQTAIYITDRFAEVFGVYRLAGGGRLPGVNDILDWLEFIESQCPECASPEWPA